MQKENFYRDLLDRITSGVYFVDRFRVITYWNKYAEELSGYKKEEVLGKRCGDLLNHIDDKGKVLCGDGCPLLETINDGLPRSAEVWMQNHLGQRIPVLVQAVPIEDDQGNITGAVEIFNDISNIKRAQAHIQELTVAANTDPVTGKYNRRGLEIIMQEWFFEHEHLEQNFGMIFVDVDRFKDINDTFGHEAGDQILFQVSELLRHAVRDTDIIGRWGGDEFLVLLRFVNQNSIQKVVDKIDEIIEKSVFRIDGQKIVVSCSLGGAVPSKKEDLNSVIRRADELMYQAKKIKNK